MLAEPQKYIRAAGLIFVLTFLCAPVSRGAVVVFDRVTTVGTPVYLKVLTKGLLFSQGGRRVEIYLDQKKLKQILTGGDGYGYLKYTPLRAGFKRIEARADGDNASGLMLVMDKRDQAIVIEVEGAFQTSFLSKEEREAGRKAVETLKADYQIIYLSRYLGAGLLKRWLEKENFPESALLPWQGPEMLAALQAKGVKLHAMIASPALLSAAADHIERRYTFEETEDGQKVKDWDEILKLLK
ncbi:MAG: hypothetical protein JSW39_07270 [Desulfobacterales bacterium]|nr:MAG: hypothetical protein JSW39_07270 [Desulfobacterales bacterium]